MAPPKSETETETRELARDAGRLAQRVDRLRRRLDSAGGLLTPVQYDRIAQSLEAVGLAGAALLMGDLAKTYAVEADANPPPGRSGADSRDDA